jgi:cell division protein FtsB
MVEHLKKYAALGLITFLLVSTAYGYIRYRSYELELARLRNQVASKDQTVEELKGTYTKLSQENDRLKSSSKELQGLLDRTKQDLIAEQQLSVYWKGKYEYMLSHSPAPIPDDGGFKPPAKQDVCTPLPKLYTATQDIGLLKLTVDTYTVDPSYQQRLRIDPGSKPLKLTLDLTRDSKQQWHTHVVSSDDRIGVDIGLNSVNISPLDLRWYERIRLHADLAASLSGVGLLTGVGAGYQFGPYELGPRVWMTTDGHGFGGLSLSWAPFMKEH